MYILTKRLWMLAIMVILQSSLMVFHANAQDKIINPDINYTGQPRMCTIKAIRVSGVEGYEEYMLTNISGLSIGQEISVPGNEITDAVKRYWRHGRENSG